MRFSKTAFQMGVMALLVAGSAWALDCFLVQPKSERIESLTRQIRDLDDQTEKITSQSSDLFKIEKKIKKEEALLKDAEEKLGAFSREMPSEEQIERLLPPGSSLVEQTERPPYSKKVLRTRAGASYQEIMDTVSAFEKATPFLKIRSLAMADKESGLFEVGQAQMEIEVIYKKL